MEVRKDKGFDFSIESNKTKEIDKLIEYKKLIQIKRCYIDEYETI